MHDRSTTPDVRYDPPLSHAQIEQCRAWINLYAKGTMFLCGEALCDMALSSLSETPARKTWDAWAVQYALSCLEKWRDRFDRAGWHDELSRVDCLAERIKAINDEVPLGYPATFAASATSETAPPIADVIEGLRVIVQRRGCKIQQGDVLALERAINALADAHDDVQRLHKDKMDLIDARIAQSATTVISVPKDELEKLSIMAVVSTAEPTVEELEGILDAIGERIEVMLAGSDSRGDHG